METLDISWFVLAPTFGLFQDEVIRRPGQLWRVAFVMLSAGQFAVVLRDLLLNALIIPVFAVVLSVTSAVGLLIWRGLYAFILGRDRPS